MTNDLRWYQDTGVWPPLPNSTGATVFTGGWWANLGNHTGINCPTVPCGVLDHVHIADECVPLGMAGLAGGC